MTSSNNTVKHWEGDHYSQNSDFQYTRALSLLETQTFNGNESILDIGCGDGKISVEIARRVSNGRVLAVDYSEDMISYARNTHNLVNLQFEIGDASSITFSREFDIITSFFCLHWVPHKARAMSCIWEALKHEGKAILIMPVRNEQLAHARNSVLERPEWKERFAASVDSTTPLTDTRYKEYAEQAGLTVTFYDRQQEEIIFSSSDKLAGFVRSITAHLAKLSSEDEKALFMSQLMNAYLEIVPPKADGCCSISYDFITLLATKEA